MSLTFWKRQHQKRNAHAKTQRRKGSQKHFLQDDCGKIIKKLLTHPAIIILRGIAPRFISAPLRLCVRFLDFLEKLVTVDKMSALLPFRAGTKWLYTNTCCMNWGCFWAGNNKFGQFSATFRKIA